jgi:hypothetical protein
MAELLDHDPARTTEALLTATFVTIEGREGVAD